MPALRARMIAFRFGGNAIWNWDKRKNVVRRGNNFGIKLSAGSDAHPQETQAVADRTLGNSPRRRNRARIRSAFGKAPGKRNAKNRSRRGQNPLRSSWQRACPVADPWLLIDLGDVAGP